ncbi:hypothetical protein PFICI_00913 [Pestalotiopsis fici W106-1]|uniref:RBR-type E3 ubiquitin transferase n=1 Tax=Pestalotiopsis fici (strain W106-1 / CGMCC3.15140) TaxID=1229662 RepID=W3XM90_PESFW|nr:uncharacterized protein PFICI_00913 [Pestalotiopsis fici W106-1]ETS87085.1 hypothetical protein PFICI_00913 [Pestalotiopsis fici W106-1]
MPQISIGASEEQALAYMTGGLVNEATIWQGDETIMSNYKGKGKEIQTPSIVLHSEIPSPKDSAVDLGGDDEGDVNVSVDYTEYEPPAGLSQIENTDSEVIVQIVHESIEKVKTRIVEDKERRLEDAREAERLAQQFEAEDAKEAEKPLATENEQHGFQRAPSIPKYYRADPIGFFGAKMIIDEHGLLRPAPASKSKQWGLKGLLKRFNNNSRGESSAQGAARNSRDMVTPDANRAFLEKSKSAVDAVLQKVSNTAPETPVPSETIEVECVSCLEDYNPKEMIKVTCHSYCTDCFHRLIKAACENEQQWPPKCCLNPIPEATVRTGIDTDAELRTLYKARSTEWSVPIADRVFCSNRECGIFIQPRHVDRSQDVARCSSGHWTCILCRAPRHGDEPCPQDRELQRTEELAESEGWKRCHRCRALVEHREACQHMTCRCGAQFCYVCGAPWRTCGCTEGQLRQIKQDAQTRRLERDAQTRREEADLAEALRQIEEFEKEEAIKAHLLMIEREYQEKQQREKEARERLRLEGERRKAVESKFQELRWELLELHMRQRVEVEREHGKEENLIKYEIEDSTTRLRDANHVQREAAAKEARNDFEEFRAALKTEYNARVKYETQLETQYQEQLQVYWANQEGGQEQIETALLDVRRRMDKGHRAYCRWLQSEIDAKRSLIRQEQSIQASFMETAERQLSENNREKQQIFTRKKTAELKWVDLVFQERHDMLDTMEATEVDDGDDIYELLSEFSLEDEMDDDLQEYFEAATTIVA